MSRTAFFKKIGAEFANPRWSWAAINHDKKEVYFGAWDHHTTGAAAVILSETWSIRSAGRPPGYNDAVKKLSYVESENYSLKVFRMINGQLSNEAEPSKIKELDETLHSATLVKVGTEWLAMFLGNEATLTDEVPANLQDHFLEGARAEILVERVERSGAARIACIQHYGAKCRSCGVDFGEVYGDLGKGFIHVHHLNPLSLVDAEYLIDPVSDLIPLCPNCHAMVHRTNPPLDPAALSELIDKQKKSK